MVMSLTHAPSSEKVVPHLHNYLQLKMCTCSRPNGFLLAVSGSPFLRTKVCCVVLCRLMSTVSSHHHIAVSLSCIRNHLPCSSVEQSSSSRLSHVVALAHPTPSGCILECCPGMLERREHRLHWRKITIDVC